MDNSRKGIALRKKQGATVSFKSERYTQIQRFAVDLSHPAVCPFPCQLPLWLQWTSRAALQDERAGMGGGTSPTGFGALPVTVPVRLLQAPDSSLPYSQHSEITLWFPCSSQQSMLLHSRELPRSMQKADLQRAHGSSSSHKGFIYGRGIQFLRSPWRFTQIIYRLDNVGLRTSQVQWAQTLGRLENWHLWSKICMLFSS